MLGAAAEFWRNFRGVNEPREKLRFGSTAPTVGDGAVGDGEPDAKKLKTDADENIVLKLNERFADANWHVKENTTEHHTNEYVRTDNSQVLRRGQSFKFTARLNRPFDESKDKIKLDLRFGSNPNLTNATAVVVDPKFSFRFLGRHKYSFKFFFPNLGFPPSINLKNLDKSKQWTMHINAADATNPVITVKSPANAFIGRYKVAIYLESTIDGKTEYALDEEPDIILLCNPWCEDDSVYMATEEERNEYVMMDVGAIWRGTTRYSSGMQWNFGQFEEGILDTTLEVLNSDKRVQKDPKKLRDPVWISRVLSAVANNASDRNDIGILTGNWTGDYSGGVSPTTWNGSVKILQQFAETKKPVNFGQCWVFSGLLTTLCRALGIPCRSVTNFASAHDTDNTMTIDAYVDENNGDIEEHNDDSVWNFHVWNEVFLTGRGHWPSTYAGWAAVDATPQESSNNIMQCGPAPIKAIKEGHIYIGYDSNFVFGEVNADRITWICQKSGRTIYIKNMGNRTTRSVGYNISTKAIGSYQRHVLDNDYKYAEGTEKEREAWQNAFNFSDRPEYLASFLDCEEEGKDINIDITLGPENPQNGKQFCFHVNVRNISSEDLSVDVNSVLYSHMYHGKKHKFITQDIQNNQLIKAKSGESFKVDVPFAMYNDKIADDQMSMKITSVVRINKTQKSFCDTLDFQMTNPSCVEILFDRERGTIYEPMNATISFRNPLPKPLSDVHITIEGPGLVMPSTQKLNGQIPPHGKASITAEITPTRSGTKTLIVDIDTAEQKDFKGSADIYVAYAF